MRLSTTINFFVFQNDGSMKPYFEDLQRYRDIGYRVLDCIFCNADCPGSPLLEDNWQWWVEQIANEAAKLGVEFSQSHVPFYNFANHRTGLDERKEEAIRRSIIASGMLGTKWTVAHPATATGVFNWSEVSKEKNIAYFEPYLKLAEDNNVGIALENMSDFPGMDYKRSYAATAEELCDLVDSFKSDHAGVCWDFGHANMMYKDQNGCLRYIGKRLKAIHVHDNDGTCDAHLAPFLGTTKWEPLMKTLAEIGYEGEFSFEIKRMPQHLPEHVKSSLWVYAKSIGEYLLSL